MRRIAQALSSFLFDTIGLEGALLGIGAIGLASHLYLFGEAFWAGLVVWTSLILAGLVVARPPVR